MICHQSQFSYRFSIGSEVFHPSVPLKLNFSVYWFSSAITKIIISIKQALQFNFTIWVDFLNFSDLFQTWPWKVIFRETLKLIPILRFSNWFNLNCLNEFGMSYNVQELRQTKATLCWISDCDNCKKISSKTSLDKSISPLSCWKCCIFIRFGTGSIENWNIFECLNTGRNTVEMVVPETMIFSFRSNFAIISP